ncbi:RNase P subunit p30-domain-containing protein [Xylariaceae sp. FL0016]|nr:RNase P subunit p30-domain-containing protein [Xylariaceae sp. FL0016]
MLYDLNIAWSPSTSASDLERTLKFSLSLGYNVVALNHFVHFPLPTQITNPLPRYPQSASSPSKANYSVQQPAQNVTSNSDPALPTVLHRATIVMADPAAQHRLPQLASSYDILAIRPANEKAWQAACLNASEASIISLDMTQQFHFHFRPKPCMAAVNRGVRFEVCYGQVLSGGGTVGGADARARAAFIGNVTELIRATRGRGIVISSEARNVLALRAPADVVNLLYVWGLSGDRAKAGLGVLPRGVVVNEGIKRSGFRGVIDILHPAERGLKPQDTEMKDAQPQAENLKGRPTDKDGRKRKNGEGVDTHATAAGSGAQDEAPISKRQAKKMRKQKHTVDMQKEA